MLFPRLKSCEEPLQAIISGAVCCRFTNRPESQYLCKDAACCQGPRHG